MNNDLMFSSKSNEWSTPQLFFDKLDKEFGFTLDPCASIENARCRTYFTEEENGLEKDWGSHIVFMNPPYGREITKWMKKAYESYLHGAIVVCLVPSRTDTKWWHDYAMKGDIRFIKGRLKFQGVENFAPFPSAVVIFKS